MAEAQTRWWSRLTAALRREALLLGVLGLAAIVGAFTFRDYGLTWDEPLFYAYADSIGYAYSIQARVHGDFDIDKAWGPSASDHRIYGPAYLLLARPPVVAVAKLFRLDVVDVWHGANFALFLVGVAALYFLCRRWMDRPAALAASALFLTQPVLWGHAFINPKDVPFLVSFTLSVLLGFRMADRWLARDGQASAPSPIDSAPSASRRSKGWAVYLLLAGGVAAAGLTLGAYLFSDRLEAVIQETVLKAYFGPDGSLLRRMFLLVAADATRLPETYYIERAQHLFWLARAVLLLLAAPLLPASIALALESTGRATVGTRAGSVWTRLRGVTAFPPRGRAGQLLKESVAPAIVLGLTTAVRVLAPFAGLLVVLHYLFDRRRRILLLPLVYGLVAAVVAFIAWPYLWEAPIRRFIEVAAHMANNPAILPVLFGGRLIFSDALPDTYLPTTLALTLTLPVLVLAVSGLAVAVYRARRQHLETRSFVLTLLWFALPFAYVLLRRPPIYDGFRHFLFIVPPLFVAAGMALQAIFDRLTSRWIRSAIAAGLLFPGILWMIRLHPYEYAYFNELAGGPAGAFRQYESDYWLTCYRQAMEESEALNPKPRTVFVLAVPEIAEHYAGLDVTVEKFDEADDQTRPGDWMLITTRNNADEVVHPDDPTLFTVGRWGATYCVVRQVP